MSRYFNFCWIAITSALLITACKGTKSAIQPNEAIPQALLWKIEKAGQAEPSYLFGTIHLIPKDDYFLPNGLEEAFDKSKNIVFEIDMDEMSDMGSMMGMFSNLMMKDGTTLKDLMNGQEYAEVSKYFDGMGLPMFLLEKVKPMFLSVLAEVNMSPDEMQSGEMISYETELYERAKKSSKDVNGLETMQYQLSLFDSIPYKDQAVMLLDAIHATNTNSDLYDQTVTLYKQQNIEAMLKMEGEGNEGDTTGFGNVLINNRNKNWIPIMSKMMKTGPVFFAVGAGHLPGDNGVLNLLKKQGYKITPVSVYKESASKRI